MIRKLSGLIKRFQREDDGQLMVEFAVVVPVIFTIFLTTVELGIFQMRQMFLDRALDLAVREVRLSTGTNFEHDDVKDLICQYAGFIESCQLQLKLEMTPVQIRSFSGFTLAPDCTDASEPVQPAQTFVLGAQHEMMLLRACYKFDPIFATTGLGYAFTEDGDNAGMAAMYSLTAFVQEPT